MLRVLALACVCLSSTAAFGQTSQEQLERLEEFQRNFGELNETRDRMSEIAEQATPEVLTTGPTTCGASEQFGAVPSVVSEQWYVPSLPSISRADRRSAEQALDRISDHSWSTMPPRDLILEIRDVVSREAVEAIAQTDPRAQALLAMHYMGERDVANIDVERACYWAYRSASADFPRGHVAYGTLLFRGYGARPLASVAAAHFERAADQGNAQAQIRLAFAHATGRGVERDYARAHGLFQMAREAGDTTAGAHLSQLYRLGLGVNQNYAQARRLAEESAAEGAAFAFTQMSTFYLEGLGVPRNVDTGIEYLRRAAAQNEPRALSALAYQYETGAILPRDLAQTVAYYQRAAELQDAYAQANLALLYLNGEGVARDLDRAYRLNLMAAFQDHPLGTNNLGAFYENGTGVRRDIGVAFWLYVRADVLGYPGARANIDRLAGR